MELLIVYNPDEEQSLLLIYFVDPVDMFPQTENTLNVIYILNGLNH